MDLQMKPFSSYCGLEVFTINGIEADYDDFGFLSDRNPEMAEPYGCGNRRFTPIDSTPEVLCRYGITQDEYDYICGELDILSFGNCGLCI